MSKPIGMKDFKHRFAVSVCRVPASRPLCRGSRLLCAFLFRTLPRCWFWPARTIELYSSSVGGSNKTKLKSCKLLMEHYAMHVCLPVPVCLSVSLSVSLALCRLYVLRFAWCGCWFSLCFIVCKFIYSYRFVADFLQQLLLRLSLVLLSRQFFFGFIGNKRKNGIVLKHGESAQRESNSKK